MQDDGAPRDKDRRHDGTGGMIAAEAEGVPVWGNEQELNHKKYFRYFFNRN